MQATPSYVNAELPVCSDVVHGCFWRRQHSRTGKGGHADGRGSDAVWWDARGGVRERVWSVQGAGRRRTTSRSWRACGPRSGVRSVTPPRRGAGPCPRRTAASRRPRRRRRCRRGSRATCARASHAWHSCAAATRAHARRERRSRWRCLGPQPAALAQCRCLLATPARPSLLPSVPPSVLPCHGSGRRDSESLAALCVLIPWFDGLTNTGPEPCIVQRAERLPKRPSRCCGALSCTGSCIHLTSFSVT